MKLHIGEIKSGPDVKDAVDPVCGMRVSSANAGYRATFEGKEYYFCSKGCREEFVQNPAKFIKEEGTPSAQIKYPNKTSGYDHQNRLMSMIVPINKMHCYHCANTVEKTLESLPGVMRAHVNYSYEEAHVIYDPAVTGLEQIRKAIQDAGYEIARHVSDPDFRLFAPGPAGGT